MKTHGLTGHKLYRVWDDMRGRCSRKTHHAYSRYGGRGISVCKQWASPVRFINWAIQNGWKDGLWLERKNNNGNYEPGNCRFATVKEQCNNRESNVRVKIDGITKTYQQWTEHLKVSGETIRHRVAKGMTLEQAVSWPKGKHFIKRKY